MGKSWVDLEKSIDDMKCKKFVNNLVDIYEEYKHDMFYSKRILYNCNDRVISNNIMDCVLCDDYKVIDEHDTVWVIIPDEYSTAIKFSVINGKMHIDIMARGIVNPKINKKAMEVLAFSLYDKL